MRSAIHLPSLLNPKLDTVSLPVVTWRASPPSGRMTYNWLAAASRSDRNPKKLPSADHFGDVSLFSFVNVSWRVDDSPPVSETRKMSVCRLASFQFGVE